MEGVTRLVGSLVEFTVAMTHGFDVSDVLVELAVRVPDVLEIAYAGVSLASKVGLQFATSNSERATLLERVQEEQQDGPCFDALRTGEDQVYADIRAESGRWPGFVEAAGRVGIVAVAAIPMRGVAGLGVLDLYHTDVHAWTPEDLDTAHIFTYMASAYLLYASDLERERRSVAQLQLALESRVVIEQAKGILASEHGITTDAAFLRLRKYARDRQANLRQVANAVVSLGLRV